MLKEKAKKTDFLGMRNKNNSIFCFDFGEVLIAPTFLTVGINLYLSIYRYRLCEEFFTFIFSIPWLKADEAACVWNYSVFEFYGKDVLIRLLGAYEWA